MSSDLSMMLMLMLAVVVGLIIKSYFVQMSFNCAMPSVTGNKSMKISLQAAVCLVILCSLLFSQGASYYMVESERGVPREEKPRVQQQAPPSGMEMGNQQQAAF